jgi:hypothetical protein
MSEDAVQPAPVGDDKINVHELEIGGLRFRIYYRVGRGIGMEVYGNLQGESTQLFRVDDFVDDPHFHFPVVPMAARDVDPKTSFDESQGEPHTWFVEQIRDHLAEWLTDCGFESVLPTVDIDEISKNAHLITEAIIDTAPSDYVFVPGVGLQRAATAPQ